MLEVLFFGAIAVFIISRLLKTLGQEDDVLQSSNNEKFSTTENQNVQDVDFEIVSAFENSLPQDLKDVLQKIKKREIDFDINSFVNGSKKAFEIIINAFNSGNTETLKFLLEQQVYEKFNREILSRKDKKIKHNVSILAIKNLELKNIELLNDIIYMTITIESEQMETIYDEKGNVISDGINNIKHCNDTWVFSRKIEHSDLWKLTDTL